MKIINQQYPNGAVNQALAAARPVQDKNAASVQPRRQLILSFDIDGTLTKQFRPDNLQLQRDMQTKAGLADVFNEQTITLEHGSFMAYKGARELLSQLQAMKNDPNSGFDLKIVFFSGGTAARNHQLLNEMVLDDGSSWASLADAILSADDLASVSAAWLPDHPPRIYDTHKKTLDRVIDAVAGQDLSYAAREALRTDTIMIDDIAAFIPKNEQDHLLRVDSWQFAIDPIARQLASRDSKRWSRASRVPGSTRQLVQEQHKLLAVAEMLLGSHSAQSGLLKRAVDSQTPLAVLTASLNTLESSALVEQHEDKLGLASIIAKSHWRQVKFAVDDGSIA